MVVANSSVLIHLSRVGRLDLLERIFGRIVIPKAVYRECVVEGRGRPGAEEIASAPWIEVRSISSEALKRSFMFLLDEGEAEVIVLAIEAGADLVILDEREARLVAKSFGLKVTGTLGVLLRAKRLGLVKSMKEELERLKAAGFRLSADLEEKALREAGEA